MCSPILFATAGRAKGRGIGCLRRIATAERLKAGGLLFLDGMTSVLCSALPTRPTPLFPITIYYAFKQSESNEAILGVHLALDGRLSSDAVIQGSGFAMTGTWPMRSRATERGMRGNRHQTPSLPALSSSAARVPPLRSLPLGGSSSTSCRLSCPMRCGRCSPATSPPWTWPRRPLDLACRCSPATPVCWMPAATW